MFLYRERVILTNAKGSIFSFFRYLTLRAPDPLWLKTLHFFGELSSS
jgi:hypothetical protein